MQVCNKHYRKASLLFAITWSRTENFGSLPSCGLMCRAIQCGILNGTSWLANPMRTFADPTKDVQLLKWLATMNYIHVGKTSNALLTVSTVGYKSCNALLLTSLLHLSNRFNQAKDKTWLRFPFWIIKINQRFRISEHIGPHKAWIMNRATKKQTASGGK